MDDCVIRRVRSEDVAEGGAEEAPRVLAAALEDHQRDSSRGSNVFELAGERGEEDGDETSEGGWSQVNGSGSPGAGSSSGKKWSGVVNGGSASTPSTAGKRTPKERERERERVTVGAKDNKVAYILFYQQIKA